MTNEKEIPFGARVELHNRAYGSAFQQHLDETANKRNGDDE